MRAVRFTKAELCVIEGALERAADGSGMMTGKDRSLVGAAKSALAKLKAAQEPAAKGADVGPIQAALVASARGKAIALEGGFARASRQCADMGVTPETAKLVGEWMARQGWLTGPMTLLDVLNKWGSWLAKAKATAPPPSLQPGLGTDGTGQGPAPAGQAPPGRRTPQGFR